MMIVRFAELADLEECCNMDSSCDTEYVWQMQTREEEGSTQVSFMEIRLPRTMKVAYPRGPEELLASWRRGECFLVAALEQEAETGERIAGYLDMSVHTWNNTGWINNLVTHRRYRRRGVGNSLLRAADDWAMQEGLERITLEAQSKNYPAIRFALKNGFVFCGYNDRYYSNGDIALFFSLNL